MEFTIYFKLIIKYLKKKYFNYILSLIISYYNHLNNQFIQERSIH